MTLLIVFVAMAIGISFVCSIAEAVLLSITPAYVALLQEKGKRSGEMLFQLKENVDRPLTAILTLQSDGMIRGELALNRGDPNHQQGRTPLMQRVTGPIIQR